MHITFIIPIYYIQNNMLKNLKYVNSTIIPLNLFGKVQFQFSFFVPSTAYFFFLFHLFLSLVLEPSFVILLAEFYFVEGL